MLPKFSIAASRLTITLRRAMRTAPLASVTETIMGRSSGVRPTARATAKRKDSRGSRRSSALTRNTKRTRKTTTWRIRKPKRRVPRSNSVSGGRATRLAAIVAELGGRPGRATTAAPTPLTTEVPRNDRPASASRARPRAACFSLRQGLAGERGLVQEEVLGRQQPASAGTRSPARRWIDVARHDLPHRDLARDAVPHDGGGLRRPAPAGAGPPAASGRPGLKLSAMLSTTISAMTTALTSWPKTAETALATSRIRTRGLAR